MYIQVGCHMIVVVNNTLFKDPSKNKSFFDTLFLKVKAKKMNILFLVV